MPELLSDEEIGKALGRLTAWRLSEGALVREVELPTFAAAIDTVDAVAVLAEAADHHPDIDIRWRTVTFRCTTHSAGGLTAADTALAARIEEALPA